MPKTPPQTKRKSTKKTPPLTRRQQLVARVKQPFQRAKLRAKLFMNRRPHRSFRRTRRRDYERSLKLPGYVALTSQVVAVLKKHRKTFLLLAALYAVLTAIIVGIASQDTYTQLSDTLRETSGDIFQGNFGEIGKAGLLLLAGAAGTYNSTPADTQSMTSVLIGILTWLTTVWLLRSFLANQRPRLRDGLYNAGAPIVPTMFVTALLTIQLLPVAIAALGYSAATASGLLSNGVEAMMFWVVAALLVTLSLYWITSTMFALVVVTLPGMYPWAAIKTAGDLVIGRRVRILLRFVWLIFTIALGWAVIMIPIILFDAWIKGVISGINWIPIVPVVLLIMSSLTVIWVASYTYVLYRKVVDDDASPA